MTNFQCPSCGAPVVFRSAASIFLTCGHCGVMVVRHDRDLEALGKVGELPGDVTAIQVGTRGACDGHRFEVVGRARWAWSDGFWNEWCLAFAADGRGGEDLGWLGEAQGLFTIALPSKSAMPHPLESIRVGEPYTVLGNQYVADDIKRATVVFCEGELPFVAPVGEAKTIVDLADAVGRYACLEYGRDGNRVYLGRYVEADELHLENLRSLDGW